MIRRPPRSTLFPYTDALPICQLAGHQRTVLAGLQVGGPDPKHRGLAGRQAAVLRVQAARSGEHTSELQSPCNLVCRLLLGKKKQDISLTITYTPIDPR